MLQLLQMLLLNKYCFNSYQSYHLVKNNVITYYTVMYFILPLQLK